jgi:putative membrane protein
MRIVVVAIASLLGSLAFAQTAPSTGGYGTGPRENPGTNSPSVTEPHQIRGQKGVQPSSSLSRADQNFVNQAAQANLAAIKVAELGVKKGSTADIRNFAQTMRDDHKKLGDKLQSIATRENFPLPAESNAEQRATYDRLSALSGPTFDRAFLDAMNTDHQQAISLFQSEAQTGTNPQLKSFAQSTLPSLLHHEQMVNRKVNKM